MQVDTTNPAGRVSINMSTVPVGDRGLVHVRPTAAAHDLADDGAGIAAAVATTTDTVQAGTGDVRRPDRAPVLAPTLAIDTRDVIAARRLRRGRAPDLILDGGSFDGQDSQRHR